jgi:hypothetical protein
VKRGERKGNKKTKQKKGGKGNRKIERQKTSTKRQ